MPLVSLHGALGSGKTRLVIDFSRRTLGAPCTVIECHPGDRASALRARAERALRCVPGQLASSLSAQARVLVIDDIQHLRVDEATSLLVPLLLGPTAPGRVIVVARDPLSAPVGAQIAELELRGLDVEAASELWGGLEDSFGEAHGFDACFAHARHPARAAVPWRIRRASVMTAGPCTARAAGARDARGTRDPAPAGRARDGPQGSRPASTSRRR